MTKFRNAIRVLLFLFPFLFALTASSQSKTSPVQVTTEDKVNNLKAALSLTENQTVQVRDILDRAAVKGTPPEKVNKKAAKKILRSREKAIDREIEALLTPEQLKKYDSFKKARRDEAKGWRKGKGSEYNF